jgi:hypothetical protein
MWIRRDRQKWWVRFVLVGTALVSWIKCQNFHEQRQSSSMFATTVVWNSGTHQLQHRVDVQNEELDQRREYDNHRADTIMINSSATATVTTTTTTATSTMNTSALCSNLPVLGSVNYTIHMDRGPPRPRGLHLVMMGDSVTRYQCISLMHYLHTGSWINDSFSEKNSLLWIKTFPSYNHHYQYAAQYFGTALQCDCYRTFDPQIIMSNVFDNWYWHDTCRNNSLSCIAQYGKYPLGGHWLPSQISDGTIHLQTNYSIHPMPLPPVWQYNWSDTIRYHVAKLRPHPQYVVINSGLWGSHQLKNRFIFRTIQQALHDNHMIGIYKTTTKLRHDTSTQLKAHDKIGCALMDHCLDVSWTGTLTNASDYMDDRHFPSHINTLFNLQLLQLLQGMGESSTSFPSVD